MKQILRVTDHKIVSIKMNPMSYRIFWLAVVTLLFSCGKPDDDNVEIIPGEWFKPAPGMSFDWQLDEVKITDEFDSEVVDLDAFETPAAVVDKLHSEGKKVIAYISVGSWENWRPDADDFPANVIGNDYDGWEGEKWLDIRKIDKLGPILQKRLDMIKEKGFDAVEPDNIDSYENAGTGFNLTEADAFDFCKWLADEAHSRGLSIGQKNATGLCNKLVSRFDWLLLEDAYADDFYEDGDVYIENNKAVFVTEYTDNMTAEAFLANVCPSAAEHRFVAILKDRDLKAGKLSCP